MRILEPSDGILAFYDGREEGATLEDTATFVDDPSSLEIHAELSRLAALGPERILPAHGDPEVIVADGTLGYHEPYETVHRDNLARVAGA